MLLTYSGRHRSPFLSGTNWNKQVAVLSFLLLSFPVHPQNVNLLELDWSSQQVLTHVLNNIFKSQKVDSKVITVPSKGQWFYLSTGRADIQVEVWEGTMSKSLTELIIANKVQVAAEHQIKSREGWWYPKFVEDICPQLPSWEALIQCRGVFINESGFDIYFSGPWEKPENARIRALKLPMQIVQLKDGNEINRKIVEAMEIKRPILIFNWSPNWVEYVYKGGFIEFPDYDDECETNAAWGVNPDLPWDCDNPKKGWLKSVISTSLKEKSPCAYAIAHSFKMKSQDLSYASYLVDVKKLGIKEAANVWLDHNKSRVNKWTEHPECEQ